MTHNSGQDGLKDQVQLTDAHPEEVTCLLKKHGCSPDKQETAVVTVIEQAEVVARDWAE